MTSESGSRTINQHLHIALHAARNLQHLGRCHLRLFLSKFVQPLQSILDVIPAK